MQACMADRGWELFLDEGDGALVVETVPGDQAAQYQSDFEACLGEYPLVVSEDDAAAYYAKLVASGECLEDLGYVVPDPPSESASVESMLNGSGIIDPLWDPYEPLFLGGLSQTEFTQAMIACPAPEWGVN